MGDKLAMQMLPDEMVVEIDSLRKQRAALQVLNEDATREISKLERQVKSARSILPQLEERNKGAIKEMNKAIEAVAPLRKEAAALSKKLAAVEKTVSAAQTERDDALRARDKVKHEAELKLDTFDSFQRARDKAQVDRDVAIAAKDVVQAELAGVGQLLAIATKELGDRAPLMKAIEEEIKNGWIGEKYKTLKAFQKLNPPPEKPLAGENQITPVS